MDENTVLTSILSGTWNLTFGGGKIPVAMEEELMRLATEEDKLDTLDFQDETDDL